MRTTFNTLDLKTREAIVNLLNICLADCVVLYTQVKQAHWTLRGPSFIAIHELFDEVGEHVLDASDTIAERIQQLGGTALGVAVLAVKNTRLQPYPLDLVHQEDHVHALGKALAQAGHNLRESIRKASDLEDPVTADILTQFTRLLDKDVWLIESHLEKVADNLKS